MNFQKLFRNRAILSAFLLAIFSYAASAQSAQGTPTLVHPTPKHPAALVGTNSLYCAGYIQTSGINTDNRIIGAVEEAEKYNYSAHDYLYINAGADKGIHVGDVFSVVRPRAHFSSEWSNKGYLGYFVQEVGAVEVVNVKNYVSAVRIKASCDSILLGDLVQFVEKRESPLVQERPPLDIFADPSGKARGHIVMARDLSEMPSRDAIVYVDLGAEDHVQHGDHLTIYRELGTGNLTQKWGNESISARDYGYDSDKYHGGKFSNMTGRKKGATAGGREVSTKRAKDGRQPWLRKVVGEAVVLNVKERTATVVITRTAAEIHTGDWVEIQ